MTFWQAWTKSQVLTDGVQLSREEIQTWNQDIGSEVEGDDPEQFIVTTTEICTMEAIETFNIQGPPNTFFWKIIKKKTTEYFLKFLIFI